MADQTMSETLTFTPSQEARESQLSERLAKYLQRAEEYLSKGLTHGTALVEAMMDRASELTQLSHSRTASQEEVYGLKNDTLARTELRFLREELNKGSLADMRDAYNYLDGRDKHGNQRDQKNDFTPQEKAVARSLRASVSYGIQQRNREILSIIDSQLASATDPLKSPDVTLDLSDEFNPQNSELLASAPAIIPYLVEDPTLHEIYLGAIKHRVDDLTKGAQIIAMEKIIKRSIQDIETTKSLNDRKPPESLINQIRFKLNKLRTRVAEILVNTGRIASALSPAGEAITPQVLYNFIVTPPGEIRSLEPSHPIQHVLAGRPVPLTEVAAQPIAKENTSQPVHQAESLPISRMSKSIEEINAIRTVVSAQEVTPPAPVVEDAPAVDLPPFVFGSPENPIRFKQEEGEQTAPRVLFELPSLGIQFYLHPRLHDGKTDPHPVNRSWNAFGQINGTNNILAVRGAHSGYNYYDRNNPEHMARLQQLQSSGELFNTETQRDVIPSSDGKTMFVSEPMEALRAYCDGQSSNEPVQTVDDVQKCLAAINGPNNEGTYIKLSDEKGGIVEGRIFLYNLDPANTTAFYADQNRVFDLIKSQYPDAPLNSNDRNIGIPFCGQGLIIREGIMGVGQITDADAYPDTDRPFESSRVYIAIVKPKKTEPSN